MTLSRGPVSFWEEGKSGLAQRLKSAFQANRLFADGEEHDIHGSDWKVDYQVASSLRFGAFP